MAPLKLAIVGGGPSAFYVASRLLSLLPKTNELASQLKIHLYDRLWAPYGLVRYGVAPDHPEVKNCTHKFDDAALDPRLRFFGNVNIGEQAPIPYTLPLSLQSLFPHYTHILFSTGCTIPILHPALPPSSFCVTALSFVHWYTQHPSRPTPPPLEHIEHVTLIGQGNVSLDVARMLLTPSSRLAHYDVPRSVLDVLQRSRVRHVSIVGRRGPFQAAYTTKELREMMNLPDASMVPLDPALIAHPEQANGGVALTRQQTRALQLLQKGSKNPPGSTEKTWSLDFFRSPTGLTAPAGPGQKARLTLAHTALDASSRAVPTGETSTIETDLVVTSLGHRADPSSPWYDPALNHLRTLGGRVLDADGRVVRNVYASGWAAMGARGVLASTMMDAYAVADTILRDHFPGKDVETTPLSEADVATEQAQGGQGDAVEVLPKEVDLDSVPPEVEQGWREGLVTDFSDWKAVDAEEIRRGEEQGGKERERMVWEEAREFLAKVRSPRAHLNA
ncbi:FAD/NAD-P-binding domain-containing protein [Cubamyces lactineus]|nr:FAD/NAD-P-binding domain-containing protein [Cubamyces lactineus]